MNTTWIIPEQNILDINYNNTQNWRINKKFTQFASLYKSINDKY